MRPATLVVPIIPPALKLVSVFNCVNRFLRVRPLVPSAFTTRFAASANRSAAAQAWIAKPSVWAGSVYLTKLASIGFVLVSLNGRNSNDTRCR